MKYTGPEYETELKQVEWEIAQAHIRLTRLYKLLGGKTNNYLLIGVRAAVRGVMNELEQAQSECRYLHDTLDSNRTSLDEMIETAKGIES